MPLIRIDAVAGRTPEQVKQLLDAAHRAMVAAFRVPERDRYQIYEEHPPEHFIVQDTGLGIPRTSQVIVVSVVSRPRTEEMKKAFYAELCRELKASWNRGQRCHGIDRDQHRRRLELRQWKSAVSDGRTLGTPQSASSQSSVQGRV